VSEHDHENLPPQDETPEAAPDTDTGPALEPATRYCVDERGLATRLYREEVFTARRGESVVTLFFATEFPSPDFVEVTYCASICVMSEPDPARAGQDRRVHIDVPQKQKTPDGVKQGRIRLPLLPPEHAGSLEAWVTVAFRHADSVIDKNGETVNALIRQARMKASGIAVAHATPGNGGGKPALDLLTRNPRAIKKH